MFLFPGSQCRELAENVARKVNLELGRIKIKNFPDQETYIRILEEVKGKECIVMQSTTSSAALMELLLILDALHHSGASEIHTIVPYLGYSRQDKIFLPGEALAAKIVLETISKKTSTITTVNAHFLDSSGEQSYEGVKINNLNAFPILADYFKEKVESPVLIAPDKGAVSYVEEAAKQCKLKYDYLQKTRLSDEEVEMKVKEMDVSRKDVIILDDIISTGGTMIKATKLLYDQGVRSVNIGGVHGVLPEGLEKISGVADEVICTNSIYRKNFSRVSLSDLIGNFIKG